ncbi:hypothetical protein E2C01_054369 [Portunus trituberculatus]|uniref:Uncharacterized protein n=1 Tax=Portunus trituberculatus TaxID=210409 RepID=A0A5B7GTI0_PORTR|nr:hypothetical protein [Portunus trituberculatus]
MTPSPPPPLALFVSGAPPLAQSILTKYSHPPRPVRRRAPRASLSSDHLQYYSVNSGFYE